MTDASARRFEVPTIGANSVRNFKSKSHTRIINLPVPPLLPKRVPRCALSDLSRLRKRGTSRRHDVVENPLPDAQAIAGDSRSQRTASRIGEMPQDQQGAAHPALGQPGEPLAGAPTLGRQWLDSIGPDTIGPDSNWPDNNGP